MNKIKQIVNHYDLYHLRQYGDHQYDKEITEIMIVFNTFDHNFNHRIWEIFSPYKDEQICTYSHIINELFMLYNDIHQ